jgi:hypothetical protein
MGKRFAGRVVDRADLRFVEAVQAAFRFLVEDLGFRLVNLEPPTFVRYESAATFLNVYHGRRSYEINVEIGRIADPVGRSYRLPDVLNALLGQDDRRQTYFQASDPQGVRRCVHAVAELVAGHYRSLLKGDDEAFSRVAAQTAEAARALTKEVVQRPVREAAEKAWHARNYAKVRELYESIDDDLSPVERKRLEYAEKHYRR